MNELLRQQVFARAAGCCEYCGVPQACSSRAFHIEHIIARQHGGEAEQHNLALSCQDCNLHKGPNLSGIDPLSGDVAVLFHPRRDDWAEHFRVSGAAVEGTTPVGRATVRVLDMNHPARILIRRSLMDEHAWPSGR